MKIRKRIVGVMLAFMLMFGYAVPAYAWTETDNFVASGHGYVNPSYLVIHSTANPGATAWNHISYWDRIGNDASMAQWVTDWTDGGTVIQAMPGNAVAWHVGNGNWQSVGIEICEATSQTDFDLGFDTAAQWASVWLSEQGYGVDRMVSHNQARYLWGGTDHTDPIGYFAKWGKSWEDFVSLVEYYLDNPDSLTYGDTSGNVPDNDTDNVSANDTSNGSIENAAYAVMMGWYGNDPQRSQLLAADGYNAAEVQRYVNEHYYGIYGSNANTDLSYVALLVYQGWYGNGQARFDALYADGYDAQAVQDYVNAYYYGI